ncbi:MAG: DNA-3-methyladenine glycosylase, partial [Candidatus Lokiarchaeota archaeon]|nr:DNA-3-methyladenine glycosylase [Candidatus Lokiarchaeota archaeon]
MNSLTRLKRDFFARKTEIVAKDILGKYLVRKTNNSKMIGKIVEV